MASTLPLDTSLLSPGMRIAVALSGGADSVALLLAFHERSAELGLVVHAAHLHHGLRGDEADADQQFCRDLCTRLDIPVHTAHVDTAAEAAKAGEGIEEAARRLRYAWFRKLLAQPPPHSIALHAIATAHTLDDQAETVLAKFLRGAWTEGLSGIHPQLEDGPILRPLLRATRAEVEAFLRDRGQSWCDDSTNRHLTYTRNRIRHELLPQLETWNPRLREHLAQMATLARDEEAAWDAEIARLAPQLILVGKPVRGGGRAATSGLAVEVTRLAALLPALQRRLLRHAAAQLGFAPDFEATEAIRALALNGRAGQKLELARGLRVERSHRELRLMADGATKTQTAGTVSHLQIPGPGQMAADAFGMHVELTPASTQPEPLPAATLRPW
ncbi:MAG TPA: tRNA lysidine(34) synthetase TilS, partial [Bryobacteraceae bacterium]|nr:tRNA lysidine(34) synthetase TilS [Bryobacteraceae bacterium]